MTVAVQLDFRDATLEQYDQINEETRLLPGNRGVAGLIRRYPFAVRIATAEGNPW